MILDAFFKALGQMGDKRFLAVIVTGFLWALGILAGFTFAVTGFVDWIMPNDFSLFGYEFTGLAAAASWATLGVLLVTSTFLMVPVASAVSGLIVERVADAVEDKHYPHVPDVPGTPLADSIRDSIGFFAVMVLANLLALVLYLIFNLLAPLIFWALNGFLLGREYFQMVAMRRLGRTGAKAARRRHFGRIWLAGFFMAIPLSIPIVNLFVPVFGVATFTHLFHRLEPQGSTLSGTRVNPQGQNG